MEGTPRFSGSWISFPLGLDESVPSLFGVQRCVSKSNPTGTPQTDDQHFVGRPQQKNKNKALWVPTRLPPFAMRRGVRSPHGGGERLGG